MTLKELRKSLSDKKARGKVAYDEHKALNAKAERTEAEEQKLAALDAELDALETECADLDAKIAAEEKAAKRGGLFATTSQAATGRAAFGQAARTVNEPDPEQTFGFRGLSEFAVAVRGAVSGVNFDARLNAVPVDREAAAPSGYNQNQGSSGEGFLVPPQFSASVWELALDDVDLFGMSAPEPTQSNSVLKPKDESTPWGAVGVQAVWAAEAGQLNASKLAPITGDLMALHKLYAFCAATDEVLSDAPMLQDRLTRQAGRALRWTLADNVMWGNGAGKLTGFMTAPSLVTVAAEGGQSAATIVIANLLKMASRVLRTGGRPIWIANSDTLPQLGQLTIGNVPAWLPNNQPIKDSPWEGTLLGYPLMFSEHAQTLGTTGDIVCANLDGYYAVNKEGGVDFAQSIHLWFDLGLQAFRWTVRVNGTPYLSKPVSPARGAATKSHFVALASRP